jgi:hypothetical protein
MKALLNDEAEMEDLFEAIESDEEFENAGMNATRWLYVIDRFSMMITPLSTFLVDEEDIVDSDFDVESGDSEVEREAEGEQEDKMIEREERQVSTEVLQGRLCDMY